MQLGTFSALAGKARSGSSKTGNIVRIMAKVPFKREYVMSSTFGKGHHLHLIDGSAYIFRAYHALPPLTRKSDGLPVGAVAGFWG